MKNLFLACTLMLCSTFAMNTKAQVKSENIANLKVDTISKKILDNTKYQVFYSMEFAKDSTNTQSKTSCQTILLIGSQYNAFLDYNTLRKDSVYDALSKKKASSTDIFAKVFSIGQQVKFSPIIIKNYPNKGICTFQQTILSRENYRYTDSAKIQWFLGDQEKEIMGYNCKEATCTYRGRQYTAWYAPDISIAEGPYVFSGLPGLIMSISDSRNHYSFTINGLTAVNAYNPIYLPTKDVIETSRNQVRKIIHNTKSDPSSLIKSLSGTVEISEEAMAKQKPKPYNPIELE